MDIGDLRIMKMTIYNLYSDFLFLSEQNSDGSLDVKIPYANAVTIIAFVIG